MFSLKRCFAGIGVAVCSCAIAVAKPPLTTVQDVLYQADGTRFEGIATISWQSFEASDSSTIPAQSLTVRIESGFVRVQLVPTTNAITPSSYTVVYNSDGKVQFAESWLVPPSNVPVRIRDVRIGSPGTVIGGGPKTPPPLTAVQITDVVGLIEALNTRPSASRLVPSTAAVINSAGLIESARGSSLSDCVHVDGTSGPCGAGATTTGTGFVDAEIPAGTLDNVNILFTLASVPNPPASLELSRNGILLRQGLDYTLSNASVTFLRGAPATGDTLLASYRVGVSLPGVTFVDAEVPSGAVDGANTVFLLSKTPAPPESLEVYRNGLRLRINLDYTINANNLIFQAGLAPQAGDVLQTSYRAAQ